MSDVDSRILQALKTSDEFHQYEINKYREVLATVFSQNGILREALLNIVQKAKYAGGIEPSDIERAQTALRSEK